MLIIGAGPTGVCSLLCTLLKNPRNIIVCEKSQARRDFIQQHYPQVMVVEPEDCEAFVRKHSQHGGADVVMEVAGGKDTFQRSLYHRYLAPKKKNSKKARHEYWCEWCSME